MRLIFQSKIEVLRSGIRILPSSQPALRQLEIEARGRPNTCFLFEKGHY